ncbi:MAG: porin [Pseudobdellovibrionaceae bacterium]|jgi:predicted porin|nr:porin [Pseudobdellovibrionaceae bacterium]
MNKLMLGAAAVALFVAATPAMAQDDSGVKLSLGGHFKGYVNYSNEDNVRDLDILRDTEVHFGGETTLDNGLTVGAHIEATTDAEESFEIDESYVYFSGTWGRVNFGAEDGAAYLLQVAAPSADENVDGIRQYISPSLIGAGVDYDNDISTKSDKVTYLSPVFSGFQAGVSFTPEAGDASRALIGNSLEGIQDTDDVWELAARYEGMVSNVGVILGAGYADAGDDAQEWNVGVDLDIGAFGLGVVYTEAESDAIDMESDTWVVGGDYTVGPYKLGLSYLNNDVEVGSTDVYDLNRYTGGVVYTYGPGMTFRGSVAYYDESELFDEDATTVTVGTQINF